MPRVRSCVVRRAGFTLVEMTVALMIGGMVLAGATAVLGSISAVGVAAGDATAVADHDANGARALRAIVSSYEPADSSASFGGDPRRAWFDSWCPVPSGWLERCSVIIAIDSVSSKRAVVAVLSSGGAFALRTGFESGQLLYLRDASNGGSWLTSWPSSLSAPVALGIVTDNDTTILRIGERR